MGIFVIRTAVDGADRASQAAPPHHHG